MFIFENQLLFGELQKLKIDISRVAFAELTPTWHRKEHTIIDNMFYLVLEGELDVSCNGEPLHLTAGDICFLPKGSLRTYQCPDFAKKLYFYLNLRNSYGEDLPITPNQAVVLKGRHKQVQKAAELFRKNDYHSAALLRLYIEQIALEVYSLFPNPTIIQSHTSLVSNVLNIIIRSPHLSLSAAALAEQCMTSVSLLRQRFKKEVGTSIGKFVQEQVLIAASHDLRSCELTLPEISAKYGFCDQFYFSRLFTAHFGTTPSKYRKEHII